MIAVITSIELKTPFKFFPLSWNAMKIMRQLRTTQCVDQKTRGFWTTHYTMTLWNNEEEMKAFARSGAHKEAMRLSAKLAKEIRTQVMETDKLPNWKEAKALLQEAKVLQFG